MSEIITEEQLLDQIIERLERAKDCAKEGQHTLKGLYILAAASRLLTFAPPEAFASKDLLRDAPVHANLKQ